MKVHELAFACLIAGSGALANTAQAATYLNLHSFSGGDGATPYDKLVPDANGVLYGVTVSGGSGQHGTVFSFDPATGTLTTLYAFTDGADGGNPESEVTLDSQGNLYGVTPRGGSNACNLGCGTVFKINIATHAFKTIYTFQGQSDGELPLGGLTLLGGKLYGTTAISPATSDCGNSGCGSIFKLSLATGALTTLHALARDEGAAPATTMIHGSGPILYGTLSEAGPNGSGSIFSLNTSTNGFAVLHGFDYHVDGNSPQPDLILRGGFLYGATNAGGPTSAADGTIFKLNLSSLVLTTLANLPATGNGVFPIGVTFGPSGILYGATSQGGTAGAGTLFTLKANGAGFTQLQSFGTGGASIPRAPMVLSHGVLYGTTSGEGGGDGSIYSVTP